MIGLGIGLVVQPMQQAGGGGEPSAADYIVTSKAEWDTVMALSTATLEGKIVEIAAPIPTQLTISGHDFSTGLTIRSATPADKIASLFASNTVNRVTLDNLHIQMTGWPSDYNACLVTGGGDFIGWTIRGGSWRHGYGASLVNLPYAMNTVDHPEIERVDHVVTATSSAVRYAINWENPAITSGQLYCFNRAGSDYFIAVGDNTVVATTSSQRVQSSDPYIRIFGLDPTTDTHFSIITASGTADANVRAEIGIGQYLASGSFSQGNSNLVDWTIDGLVAIDLNNGISLPINGTAIYRNVVLDRIYQDNIKSLGYADTTYLLSIRFTPCIAVSGIAENLGGHAGDPHGDWAQGFGTGTGGMIFVAGSWFVNAPVEGTAQSLFISDRDAVPSYEGLFSVANFLGGGSANGIALGEPAYPASRLFVHGDTILNSRSLAGPSNIRVVLEQPGYVASSVVSGAVNEDAGPETVVVNTLELGGYTGPEETYFPNWDDMATASDLPALVAALTTTGDAAGKGAAAHQDKINRNATDPADYILWANLPSGVGWNTLTAQAASTQITLPPRRVLNRRANQAISVGAGTEYQILDADGLTVHQAWGTASGTVQPDEWVQLRGTSAAAGGSVDFTATINGQAVSVTVESEVAFTPFVLNGAYFQGPENVPSNVTAIRHEAKLRLNSATAIYDTIFARLSVYSLEVATDIGVIRIFGEDNSGSALAVPLTELSTLPPFEIGTIHTVGLTWDTSGTGQMVGTLDGVSQVVPFAQNVAGTAQATRRTLFGRKTTTTEALPADTQVEYLRIYYTVGGVETLHKEISLAAQGSIAGINADSWTVGTVTAA